MVDSQDMEALRAAPKPSQKTVSLALPLQLTPHTTLHIQLTRHAACTVVYSTTSGPSTTSSLSALGSFIFALPNVGHIYSSIPGKATINVPCILILIFQRFHPNDPLCTPIYASSSTADFATRIAKAIARKTKQPAYVSWSGGFGIGGAEVEEEMEGLQLAVQAILKAISELNDASLINGHTGTP